VEVLPIQLRKFKKEQSMNNILQAKSVYHQPDHIPENLLIWQDENSGIAALVNAAQDITEGKRVTFALCDREGTLQPTIKETVTIAMGYGGKKSEGYQPRAPRFCGEKDDPNGAGSHALIPSYYDYCCNPAAIATALALSFKCSAKHYFRLRNGGRIRS
jgi:hypothetical protein